MAYELLETCVFVPGVNTTQCASWVQAIGSVLAIVAAVLVARHQSKRMELALRDDECRRMESKFAPPIIIIETAIKEMHSAYNEALTAKANGEYGVGPEFKDLHRWYAEAFSKIEAHTMPTAQSVKLVLGMHALLREAGAVMDNTADRLNQLLEITLDHQKEFELVLSRLEFNLKLLRQEVKVVSFGTKPCARLIELARPPK